MYHLFEIVALPLLKKNRKRQEQGQEEVVTFRLLEVVLVEDHEEVHLLLLWKMHLPLTMAESRQDVYQLL